MKIKKTKLSAIMVVCFSLLIISVLVTSLFLPALGAKETADTFTVYEDGEYYTETTYYRTKEAYKRYLKSTADNSDKSRKNLARLTAVSDDPDKEFVITATKSVCVLEEYNEDSEVEESRPLKKDEIEQLFEIEAPKDSGNGKSAAIRELPPIITIPDLEPRSLIGKDRTILYCLTIEMSVIVDNKTGEYEVSGTSKWQNESSFNHATVGEKWSLDYIGLTWGGNGSLCATKQYTYAQCWDNNEEIPISKRVSDSYAGFVWAFHEVIGYTHMNFAVTSVKLKTVGEKQGKETSAKLTYIHTYTAIEVGGSLSLTIGANGLAGGVVFSTTGKYWQIQIDVPGIKF